jgi:dihydrodipicolinate synthase/N-acetylneuraminate lyase
MHMLGRLQEENLRLPMTPVTDATRKRLAALVAELGLLEPAVVGESRRAS